MGLPQARAGDGARNPRVHFAYVSTSHGKNWHAWIAGPCHWFHCHSKGKTKPCLYEMTGGEMGCDRCDAAQPCEVVGYQPLYRELDSKPVMVIVHEYTREVLDGLRLHARVTVGRGDSASDGVYVVPALKAEPRFQTTLQHRMVPADLTETLLRVWKIPELEQWYRQTHGAAKPPETQKSDGKPFSPWTRKAAQRASTGPLNEELDDVMARIKMRSKGLPEPSSNGKHDPPPKG